MMFPASSTWAISLLPLGLGIPIVCGMSSEVLYLQMNPPAKLRFPVAQAAICFVLHTSCASLMHGHSFMKIPSEEY